MAATPLKPIILSIHSSVPDQPSITLDIPNAILRTIKDNPSFHGSYIDFINSNLKYTTLCQSERLETRLANEESRTLSDYKIFIHVPVYL